MIKQEVLVDRRKLTSDSSKYIQIRSATSSSANKHDDCWKKGHIRALYASTSSHPMPCSRFVILCKDARSRQCLRALCNARNVGATAVSLTTSDGDIAPGPPGARGRASAGNNDVVSRASYRTSARDVLNDQASDGNTSGGSSVQIATIVVLLNQDTIPEVRLAWRRR